MTIRYVRDVATPPHLAGAAGETKDLQDVFAQKLIDTGYAVAAEPAEAGADDADAEERPE